MSTLTIGKDQTVFLGEDEDEEMTMSIPRLRAIQILDTAEIASHRTRMIAGLCSHTIWFVNGGLLQFAFNQRDRIIGLSASNLVQTLSADNDLIYRTRL
ncbi:hypothetical protein AAKU64_004221 [Undibacterium sp. GrIS 1.8]